VGRRGKRMPQKKSQLIGVGSSGERKSQGARKYGETINHEKGDEGAGRTTEAQ